MKRLSLLGAIALLFTSLSYANSTNPPFLEVGLRSFNESGMFSVFTCVLGALTEYETKGYGGVEINFGDRGHYYDPQKGENWWEYFCKPIAIGYKEGAPIKRFTKHEYIMLAFQMQVMNRKKAHNLIQKYIHIQEPIEKKIDEFARKNFSDTHVIGVHYRGTDKVLEAPRVAYTRVMNEVRVYIQAKKLTRYKIFIATDELPFKEFMEKHFTDTIISYSKIYSNRRYSTTPWFFLHVCTC